MNRKYSLVDSSHQKQQQQSGKTRPGEPVFDPSTSLTFPMVTRSFLEPIRHSICSFKTNFKQSALKNMYNKEINKIKDYERHTQWNYMPGQFSVQSA